MNFKFKAVVIVDPQVDFTTGSLKMIGRKLLVLLMNTV